MSLLIHRYWEGDPHPMSPWIDNVIRTQHPMHGLKNWTSDTMPWPDAPEVEQESSALHRSNLTRYKALFDFGGLWLDNDVIPLTNLMELHEGPWVAAIREGSGRHVANGSCMFFPESGHPLLAELLRAGLTPCQQPVRSGLQSGGKVLNALIGAHPDVSMETRALPFDAQGRRQHPLDDPVAVHLWSSRSRV